MIPDTWSMIPDTWPMIPDTWSMILDIWFMIHVCTGQSAPIVYHWLYGVSHHTHFHTSQISKTSEAVGLFWQVCGTLAVAEKVTYHDLMHYTLGPTTPSTTCVHPDPVSTSFPLNCCYVHRSWSIP